MTVVNVLFFCLDQSNGWLQNKLNVKSIMLRRTSIRLAFSLLKSLNVHHQCLGNFFCYWKILKTNWTDFKKKKKMLLIVTMLLTLHMQLSKANDHLSIRRHRVVPNNSWIGGKSFLFLFFFFSKKKTSISFFAILKLFSFSFLSFSSISFFIQFHFSFNFIFHSISFNLISISFQSLFFIQPPT